MRINKILRMDCNTTGIIFRNLTCRIRPQVRDTFGQNVDIKFEVVKEIKKAYVSYCLKFIK